jgi:hypothetical protein
MFDNLVHCHEAVHFEVRLWDLNPTGLKISVNYQIIF